MLVRGLAEQTFNRSFAYLKNKNGSNLVKVGKYDTSNVVLNSYISESLFFFNFFNALQFIFF